MVMTRSEALYGDLGEGFWGWRQEIDVHLFHGCTTAGLMVSAGAVPAERTMTRPVAWWSRRAAAIWERPALWTQTNSTSAMWSGIGHLAREEEADQDQGDGGADELHEDEHRRRRRF